MTLPILPRRAAVGGAALLAAGLVAFIAVHSPDAGAPPIPYALSAAFAADAVDPTRAGRGDHTMFGGSPDRNMVNLVDKGLKLPTEFKADDEAWTKEWLLWKAELGSRAYGGPIVAGGKVYVGTNNERPRNKRDVKGDEPIDKGNLYCLEEKSGRFLWQAVFDKLPSGQVHDWPKEGLCSSPTVEGNRVYFVSNRCTVVCADADGFANGNDGITTERYKDPTDADVIWEYDMMKELNVFPHNMSCSCPLIVGDILYAVTANGVDEGHINIPSPEAPSFVALDKKTGRLIWKSGAPGRNIMHGQWSNPVYADIGGVRQVIFPGGDGWLRAYVPETGGEIWRFDCNPKDAVYELGGAGTRSDFIGTPVVHDGKVYIGVGQDPEHTTGIGHFWCIAPARRGDISPQLPAEAKGDDGKAAGPGKPNPHSCAVWTYGGEEKRKWAPREFKFGRTMSTACIVDDILYISELQGYIHCLNAKTGEHYWQYDTKGTIWGSAYYVDGRVILASESGDFFVFKHDPKPKKIDEVEAAKDAPNMKEARKLRLVQQKEVEKEYLLAKFEFDAPIRSTAIVANGVLYVMTEKTLYALKSR